MADPGKGPGGPVPPSFLDQNETGPPLTHGLDDPTPPPPLPYLKVWICHWEDSLSPHADILVRLWFAPGTGPFLAKTVDMVLR